MPGLVPALVMSNTKDDLLKALNMGPDTYAQMAKEADHVYRWLTQGRYHLKDNCSRAPPYDWSDIRDRSKDEAFIRIAQSGDSHTSYYWNLAEPTDDCPNWIARWFLYHKFRYRDGRNRNPARADDGKHSSHGSSRSSRPSGSKRSSHSSSSHSRSERQPSYPATKSYQEPSASYYSSLGQTTAGSDPQQYYASDAYSNSQYPPYYSSSTYTQGGYEDSLSRHHEEAEDSSYYYDPVRDSGSTRRR